MAEIMDWRGPMTYGVHEAVSPLVRRILAPNPGPYTYMGTVTYLVGVQEQIAVIDPGPKVPSHIHAILSAAEGQRISHIFLTHTHLDHSPAATELKLLTGAAICGREVRIADGADGTRKSSMDYGHDQDIVFDTLLAHGQVVAGDGWTLETIYTPGHTGNHLCYALHEERAVFSGDHVMAWSTTAIGPRDGNMTSYMGSLKELAARDDAIYWPAHGGPVLRPQMYVNALLRLRMQRRLEIVNKLRIRPLSLRDLTAFLYRGVDERLSNAAQQAVIAHLEELVEANVIEYDESLSPEGGFRLRDAASIELVDQGP